MNHFKLRLIRQLRLVVCLSGILALMYVAGCSSDSEQYDDTELLSYLSGNGELFENTDAFVDSLYTTYESYGILKSTEYSRTTSEGLYTIMPVGRLVNVKIQQVATEEEYGELRDLLKNTTKMIYGFTMSISGRVEPS
jgi:hypothetical protein